MLYTTLGPTSSEQQPATSIMHPSPACFEIIWKQACCVAFSELWGIGFHDVTQNPTARKVIDSHQVPVPFLMLQDRQHINGIWVVWSLGVHVEFTDQVWLSKHLRNM
jgi:hypothetical protein